MTEYDDTAEVATGVAEAVLESAEPLRGQQQVVYSVSSWINESFLQAWLNTTLCATQRSDDVVEFDCIFRAYRSSTRAFITKHEFVCAVVRLLRLTNAAHTPCTCAAYKETHLHRCAMIDSGGSSADPERECPV